MFQYLKSFFNSKVSSLSSNNFWYAFNDPTTPDLGSMVHLKKPPKNLNFKVRGLRGRDLKNGSQDHQAACCLETMCRTIGVFQSYIKEFRQPFKKWAVTNSLLVIPRAGRDFNAYYDRKTLSFFGKADPKTKKMIYTADSADIIAHEAGHALLDAMRPDFWSVHALEIWSFHEAFADITAILTLMESNEVLEHALRETNGTMKGENVISKLAEEMGSAIFNLTDGRGGYKKEYLRRANNDFKYINPKLLPKQAPNNKLAAECHSFGRVFLGAWYEIMVEIYADLKEKEKCQTVALLKARNFAASCLIQAVARAPRTPRYYEAIAKAMMAVDRTNNGTHGKIMRKVFVNRKILKEEVSMLSDCNWDDFRLSLGKDDELWTTVRESDGVVVSRILKRKSQISLKLSDYNLGSLSSNNNPLYDIDVEIAQDDFYEFDEKGNLVEEVLTDGEEALESAVFCLNAIQDDDELKKMWDTSNGKLERIYIQ